MDLEHLTYEWGSHMGSFLLWVVHLRLKIRFNAIQCQRVWQPCTFGGPAHFSLYQRKNIC
jgi:hypothetical protein